MDTRVLNSEWAKIEDVEAAAILTDLKALRHLAPFMGTERTVGEAAKELGLSTQAMFYWVRKFCELQLLRMTREEPRGGKALKYYCSSAKRYFIPFRLVPVETLEALARLRDKPWEEAFDRNLVQTYHDTFEQLHTWGVCVLSTGGQGVRIDLAPETGDASFLSEVVRRDDMPAVLSCWLPLQLDYAEAKALQRELDAIARRYQKKRGAQAYLAHIALTPVRKE